MNLVYAMLNGSSSCTVMIARLFITSGMVSPIDLNVLVYSSPANAPPTNFE